MEKTAFCTRQGKFEFPVMPLGLVNASFMFQKMIVLNELKWQICMINLDDVIAYSKSFETNLENFRLVIDRLKC